MNCLKAEEQFSAYIEDELDYQAVRAFEAHLSTCESCRREFTLFRESLDLLHQLPQIEPSSRIRCYLASPPRGYPSRINSVLATRIAALARSSSFGIGWHCGAACNDSQVSIFIKKR